MGKIPHQRLILFALGNTNFHVGSHQRNFQRRKNPVLKEHKISRNINAVNSLEVTTLYRR